jgi:hypothetical protein
MCFCNAMLRTPCCGRKTCHTRLKPGERCQWCTNHYASNTPPTLYDALKAEGFQLPRECRDVLLVMPVDGVYVLRYEVNLLPEDLAMVGRALMRIGDRTAHERKLRIACLACTMNKYGHTNGEHVTHGEGEKCPEQKGV